ncbi:PEP-CTERM protein-sorting domain-containing protein [Duganella sp. CF517]|uniref:PEP-CTERM sorting domain-containing protein n=1 Tax=Duganella sp. CF517 TaxID=1881038 RepID=UPI0008AB56DB|nr:PEP-CTERM sorting domain-containing protein [Duganella sp. CF517]SEN54654.1 PEP-CTERM protein-sorting domain-containing protein [Duganella sp. CF517]
MNLKQLFTAIVIAAATLSGAAHADTVYSNADDGTSAIAYMGEPDTTSYGQFFTAPGGWLKDFSFQALSGASGDLALVVAAWDGSKAVGPALYTSAPITYEGGSQFLGASGINLALTAGTNYIAYLTVANIASPVSYVTFAGSDSDTGLGGGFRYLNSNLTDPLTLSESWNAFSTQHLAYTATFGTASAVPEPGTYVMLLAGMGMMGAIARRRKNQA